MMSIGSNPEYGAKHWLNSSLSNTVPNSNTLQAAGASQNQMPPALAVMPRDWSEETAYQWELKNGTWVKKTEYQDIPHLPGFRTPGSHIYDGYGNIIERWEDRNRGGITAPGENGSGIPPIDYRLPKDFTGFGENGSGRPPVFETQALYENGGITAHGSGLPPIDYRLPKDFTGFGENGIGIPPQQNDPYYMVKSPWMNAGQNYPSSHASAPNSWYF